MATTNYFVLFLLRTLAIEKEFHYESYLTQYGRSNIQEDYRDTELFLRLSVKNYANEP